jgi:hypothetical protein
VAGTGAAGAGGEAADEGALSVHSPADEHTWFAAHGGLHAETHCFWMHT